MNKFAFIILSFLAVILFILMIIFDSADNENITSVTKDFARPQAEQKAVMREQAPPSVNESRAVFQKSETFTPSKVPADGLVAYYPFSGNANDASGNGNHGAVHGATLTEDRFGNPNSAYYFDGIDDEINLGTSEIFDLRKEVSIYITFKFSEHDFNFSPLVYKGWINGGEQVYNGWEREYSVWIVRPGLIHASFADRINSEFLNTPKKTISPDTWYSLLVIFDRTEGKIKTYVNNELISVGNARKTESVYSPQPLLIGASKEKYRNFSNFKGVIDEVRIFNKALTDQEIEKLFNTY